MFLNYYIFGHIILTKIDKANERRDKWYRSYDQLTKADFFSSELKTKKVQESEIIFILNL